MMASKRFVRGEFLAGRAMFTFSTAVVETPPPGSGNVLYGTFWVTQIEETKTSES
jgi:hypothetical protein